MKKMISITVLCLTAWTVSIAQNTPRVDRIIAESNSWSTSSYQACIDSLIPYIMHYYGGSFTYHNQTSELSAAVRGSDDILRQVTSHIADSLSALNSLQTYTERIDDGQDLRGRIIMKLKPEDNDSTAFVLVKYNRRTIQLKLCKNKVISLPTGSANTNNNPPVLDEELTGWKTLRREFYDMSIMNGRGVQMKWTLYDYEEEDIEEHYKFFITEPTPSRLARTKQELIQLNDSDRFAYNLLSFSLPVVGREEGSTYGSLTNPIQELNDTCHYVYACRTAPNGLSELIGVTHEAGITYLTRATSEEPGLCVWPWGRTAWAQAKENRKEEVVLGVYVIDDETDKTIKDIQQTFYEPDRITIIERKPQRTNPIINNGGVFCHISWLPVRQRYMVKVEADGYETGWGEIILDEEKMQGRTEVVVHRKR